MLMLNPKYQKMFCGFGRIRKLTFQFRLLAFSEWSGSTRKTGIQFSSSRPIASKEKIQEHFQIIDFLLKRRLWKAEKVQIFGDYVSEN